MQIREFGFGGSMKFCVAARALFVVVFAFVMSPAVLGQGLPLGVTPGMVDQLRSMPASEQQALAKQYGITLPAGSTASLDVPGLPLPALRFKHRW